MAGPTATVGSPARLADDTAQGKTTIAASVVQKIAGIAAREISGVYAMGGGVSRAFGAIRERIPGGGTGVANVAGVQVEVGEKQAAIDLTIAGALALTVGLGTAAAGNANAEENPSLLAKVDNPYSGGKGYVNPEWKAKADAESGGSRISNNPTAVWIDRIAVAVLRR